MFVDEIAEAGIALQDGGENLEGSGFGGGFFGAGFGLGFGPGDAVSEHFGAHLGVEVVGGEGFFEIGEFGVGSVEGAGAEAGEDELVAGLVADPGRGVGGLRGAGEVGGGGAGVAGFAFDFSAEEEGLVVDAIVFFVVGPFAEEGGSAFEEVFARGVGGVHGHGAEVGGPSAVVFDFGGGVVVAGVGGFVEGVLDCAAWRPAARLVEAWVRRRSARSAMGARVARSLALLLQYSMRLREGFGETGEEEFGVVEGPDAVDARGLGVEVGGEGGEVFALRGGAVGFGSGGVPGGEDEFGFPEIFGGGVGGGAEFGGDEGGLVEAEEVVGEFGVGMGSELIWRGYGRSGLGDDETGEGGEGEE